MTWPVIAGILVGLWLAELVVILVLVWPVRVLRSAPPDGWILRRLRPLK